MDATKTLKAALAKHNERHEFNPGDVVVFKRGFTPPYRTMPPLIVVARMTTEDQAAYAKNNEPGRYEREDLYCAGYSEPRENPMQALKKGLSKVLPDAVVLGPDDSEETNTSKLFVNAYDSRFLEPFIEG